VAPHDGALVTVGFIDESVGGIENFIIGQKEHHSWSVAGKPLLKAVNDDSCHGGWGVVSSEVVAKFIDSFGASGLLTCAWT
jgi:hypothetical protein